MAAQPEGPPGLVFFRIVRGITEHFERRTPEWLGLVPAFGMAWALTIDPGMFAKSASYAVVSAWGDEAWWRNLVLGCALVRLVALTINGTFPRFRRSPLLRAGASLCAWTFWLSWWVGFVAAYVSGAGAASGVAIYTMPVIAELLNVRRSAADFGTDLGERARWRA